MSAVLKMNDKIISLVDYLNTITSRVGLNDLEKVLRSLDITVDDVSEYLVFKDECYQRNMISSGQWYDLLVMCWKPQQHSSIHDHDGSSCGFKILAGVAWESVFKRTNSDDPECSTVRKTKQRNYSLNTLCLANDSDIHRIENRSSADNLVTLHIYSPPLKMNCFNEA